MDALRDAVSELLKAQERFFDAFEDAVAKTLEEPERLAMQGSDHSGEGGDRLSLLLSIMRHAQALRDCLLIAEESEAQQLAEAWVKITASDVSAKTSDDAPGPSQEEAAMPAMVEPNRGREVTAL